MKKFTVYAALLALCTASVTQAQTNQRTQFNQGLAMFNELVMQHELGEAIDLIQIDKAYEEKDIEALNDVLRKTVPDDFVGSSTVQTVALKNGFRQELLAYWTEAGDYFYVYILMHRREDGFAVLNLQYGKDVQELLGLF